MRARTAWAVCDVTATSPRQAGTADVIILTSLPAGIAARNLSSKCSRSSFSPGGAQHGDSASLKRAITQRSWAIAGLPAAAGSATNCLSAAQLG